MIHEIITDISAKNHSNCDATQGIVSIVFHMQCQSPDNMVMCTDFHQREQLNTFINHSNTNPDSNSGAGDSPLDDSPSRHCNNQNISL
jgi:hypothetical protein